MRRSLIILVAALLAAGGLGAAAFFGARSVCVSQAARGTDDLAWLRDEFHLSGAELQRVRQLHNSYLPKCHELCARIAVKNKELQAALAAGPGVSPEAARKLAEIGALRTQCQTQMLEHFYEVSQAMPAEQGRRYLAEMQRLTLGFHEQIEHQMSGEHSSHDGHH